MIHGVRRIPLIPNLDPRGSLTEVFHRNRAKELEPAQLVLVMRSRPGTMRGSHVHRTHTDYFVVVEGFAYFGLRDVRKKSPTFGKTDLIEMDARDPSALIVGPGIIHGYFSMVESILITVESTYYDPKDEEKVNWADPALQIPWPCDKALASYEEGGAPSLDELMEKIAAWQKDYKV